MTLLVAAAVLAPGVQNYKYFDIDRFDTPLYQESFAKNQAGGNEWFDLSKAQCLFPRRAINVQTTNQGSGGTLTLSLGNREQKVETTGPMGWFSYLQVNTDLVQYADLSGVDLIYVDFYTVPSGKYPDILILYARDTSGRSSFASWYLRPGGVYFRKSDFSSNLDWKHICLFKLRQDFDLWPNPTTYSVTRFYARVKPGGALPALHVK